MKPTAYLVNTARGPIVDSAALERALREGWIAGAALDVTDPEPLPADHPLLGAPNLLVVPHIGSATHRTREAMAELAVDNLIAGLAGERLPRCVNPEVYARLAEALLAQLGERLVGLGDLDAHPGEHGGGLRELDLTVVDHLDPVAPGVGEVESAAGQDPGARSLQRHPRRLLVVDDEAEVPGIVRRLRAPLRERQELVAHVEERHPGDPPAELELEDRAVEAQRLVEVADLERHVVDPEQSRTLAHVKRSDCAVAGGDDGARTSARASAQVTGGRSRCRSASAAGS